jgi:hypothetical protein
MSSILKSLFSFKSKQLSKDNIMELWRKSNKHLQTAEETIFKLDDESLIGILHTIDIRTINHLGSLITIVKRKEKRNLFEPLIQHLEFANKIFAKLDIFDYGYVFLNKYDFLESILLLNPSNDILGLLYEYYFTEANYLNGVVYALQRRGNTLLKFFLSLDRTNTTTLNMNGFKLEKSKCLYNI